MQHGYAPDFLDVSLPLPGVSDDLADDLVLVDGRVVVDYTHFSLSMSRSRRMARWVAWNVDRSGPDNSIPRVDFKPDPHPDLEGCQIPKAFYEDNRLDRGHIARKEDVEWGDSVEAKAGSDDSFFLTNITPQMDNFNQSKKTTGVWGKLENALIETGRPDGKRLSMFGGPVLGENDHPYDDVLVPVEFWKLALYRIDGEVRSRGFVLSQSFIGLEGLDPELDPFETFAATVAELEARTGVRFDTAIHAAHGPPAEAIEGLGERAPIQEVGDIAW